MNPALSMSSVSGREMSGVNPVRQRIAILGSTGSIGVNALKVISSLKDRFEVVALSADSNIKLLSKQASRFRPKIICIGDSRLWTSAGDSIPAKTKTTFSVDGLKEIVSRDDVDLVLFAISGNPCLVPLVHAIEHKKRIALANKEALVSAGSIIMRKAKENGVDVIPIDSEHSAIFQCLEGKRKYLRRIYLTGSGGPLLSVPKSRFDKMTKRFILNHPKWRMGRKISVDSATMMNKGLEIIEASHLFGVNASDIEVLIHPEAIIHSMVELIDGTVFAQLGIPDMRIPIQYALTHPSRLEIRLERLDFLKLGAMSFAKPDERKFPCLGLAREAARRGGTHPAVLSAADEEAVKLYLDGSLKFSEINKTIEKVLARHVNMKNPKIGDIIRADSLAREEVRKICYH